MSRHTLTNSSYNRNIVSRASRDVDYFNKQGQNRILSQAVEDSGTYQFTDNAMSPGGAPQSRQNRPTMDRFMGMLGAGGQRSNTDNGSHPYGMSREGNQIMDNYRLASRSETFLDDDGTKIVKRCYFLAIGDDDIQGNALSLVLSYNIFEEPNE